MVSLENHVKLHSGEKEFKCLECGSAFATNHSLKCHRKIHERKSTTYDCPVCQKKMSNKSSLNQHIKTHTGTKPHQ
jgi:KRAB domain-containing zinc finger protein